MSIELRKAAQDLLQALTLCRMDARLMHADDAQRLLLAGQALRAAIQQAEAQQPATGEPVGFTYQAEIAYADSTGGNGSFWRVPPDLDDESVPLYTRPAPSVPKDDQIAALVNKVRDIARMFNDHRSLRERIAIELVPALKASQEVKSNAERWRYAIADSGNQSMNFIDIFDDWDGDGSFVEAFDKARLADKKEGSAA